MKAKKLRRTDVAFRLAPVTIALAGLLGFIGNVSAFVVPSENPDIAMSWDQTLRYNAGWRLKNRDPGLSNNLSYDEGDYKFGKHDMITNRIDLFSEFDLKYKDNMGLRISGEAWFDSNYNSRSNALPGTSLPCRTSRVPTTMKHSVSTEAHRANSSITLSGPLHTSGKPKCLAASEAIRLYGEKARSATPRPCPILSSLTITARANKVRALVPRKPRCLLSSLLGTGNCKTILRSHGSTSGNGNPTASVSAAPISAPMLFQTTFPAQSPALAP